MKPGARQVLKDLFEQVKQEVGLRTDINPKTHISPRAKILIAASIAFGLIISALVYFEYKHPDIIIDFGIASKLAQPKKQETFRWPWLSDDELTTSGGKN